MKHTVTVESAPQAVRPPLTPEASTCLQSNAAANSAKCKEWSFRASDGACRLFIDNRGPNQAAVALVPNISWHSGVGECSCRQCLVAGPSRGQLPVAPASLNILSFLCRTGAELWDLKLALTHRLGCVVCLLACLQLRK